MIKNHKKFYIKLLIYELFRTALLDLLRNLILDLLLNLMPCLPFSKIPCVYNVYFTMYILQILYVYVHNVYDNTIL